MWSFGAFPEQVVAVIIALVVILDDSTTATSEIPTQNTASCSRSDFNVDDLQPCFPKPWNTLYKQRLVIPMKNCSLMRVVHCYCLTSESTASDPVTGILHASFSNCFYGCFNIESLSAYYLVSLQEEHLNYCTCSRFNRKGLLCGQCNDGYGPAAYSFSLKCVKCSDETHWTHIAGYILAAYGPLTVFLGFIVVFTVRVNSAPLHGWILVCQLVTSPNIMRTLTATVNNYYDTSYPPALYVLGTIYGVWNLDFFRTIYKPFCLHPSLTTLQVMSLEYLIAAYPLVLIAVIYVMVDKHSHGCQPLVFLWKPFHYCFTCFRHELNIKTSLVDAFGTFFSLSYVKFLNTTLDLVAATKVWSYNGRLSHHIYYDGTMELFKGWHILFGVVAVLVTLLCNVLPLLLILFYSFRRTNTLLNYLPLRVRLTLFPFMDSILGCYKDGTNGTRNCRYFGIAYHLALIFVCSAFLFVKSVITVGLIAFICIVVGMLVAVIQPYKSKVHNTVDTILILSIGLGFGGSISFFVTFMNDPTHQIFGYVMASPPYFIPLVYITGYLGIRMKRSSLFAQAKSLLCHTLLRRRRSSQLDDMSVILTRD